MSRGKWVFLLGVALFVIALDQVSKAWIVANLELYEVWAPIPALSDYFTIIHITNTGAAFGLFQGGSVVFQIIALVVVAIILYFYRELTNESWLMRLALGLQLGGAVGNLIDRARQGYVVDFLDFQLSEALDWPVFNVADSSIVIGVGLLLLLMWLEDRHNRRQPQETSDSADPPPDSAPAPPAQSQSPLHND